jgi:hypothetical protein
MSARGVGRVALVALAIGMVAVVGETSGVAPAWAVVVGVAVALSGAPPVAPRGLTAVAAGGGALLALWLLTWAGASAGLAAAGTAGLLVAAAGLARLRDDPRAPALAVLLGGGTVLAGAHVAGATGAADVAPALGGLVAGLLPVQVAEILTGLRATRHAPPPDAADGREDPDAAGGQEDPVPTADHGAAGS